MIPKDKPSHPTIVISPKPRNSGSPVTINLPTPKHLRFHIPLKKTILRRNHRPIMRFLPRPIPRNTLIISTICSAKMNGICNDHSRTKQTKHNKTTRQQHATNHPPHKPLLNRQDRQLKAPNPTQTTYKLNNLVFCKMTRANLLLYPSSDKHQRSPWEPTHPLSYESHIHFHENKTPHYKPRPQEESDQNCTQETVLNFPYPY